MTARAPWRQLSPHNVGCYPDASRQIMQWIWWEVHIDHNHVTVCFLCNICSHVCGYHLVKRPMMELALLKGTLQLGAGKGSEKQPNNHILEILRVLAISVLTKC